MKNLLLLVACVAVSIGSVAGQAQDDANTEVSLVGTTAHAFTSDIMGEDITIAVSIPFGYNQSEDAFPLMLALDGNVMFGMTSEVPRLMSFEGSAPPMVVASIFYGDFQKWIAGRARDFHSKDGGAEKFLAALRQEILPFIAANYRIKDDDKALYGHSSGGLFAAFVAAEAPTLFQRILASSPSLEEEPAWAPTLLAKMRANTAGLPRIYFSVDKSEVAMQAAIAPFDTLLSGDATQGRYRYDVIDQGGHMAVIPNAYGKGLRWLYAAP
ncbi:alpha/beta hydrolase [Kordiimonas aquimaris]|uniref:alpha/beta hydrolase n=1 Tax=Kordiimonas aquimaris TaxID=707591 RepID=UPI0021CEA89B|nr:esterase family protein [Kordiimonas aquimaris]